MTPELQLFMVLGALVLLCIIFTLLKRGLMSVKYSLLWLLLAVALVIFTTWKPLNAIWGAYLFGMLYWLYQFLPTLLGITLASYMTDLVQMLPYVVTVLVLIAVSMRKKKEDQPPAHLGLAYFREER